MVYYSAGLPRKHKVKRVVILLLLLVWIECFNNKINLFNRVFKRSFYGPYIVHTRNFKRRLTYIKKVI